MTLKEFNCVKEYLDEHEDDRVSITILRYATTPEFRLRLFEHRNRTVLDIYLPEEIDNDNQE
jgi:hypothetical protein